jgi:bifunctional non-homologous end joining protein LigD
MRDRQTAPAFVEPMLLGRGDQIPDGLEWLTQVKVDGVRGQLRIGDGPPSLRTRHGRQCAAEFPEIIAAAGELPDTILDGEIAVIGSDGAPDFPGVLARLGRSATSSKAAATVRPATFFAFDVLWYQGQDLRRYPLTRRLQVLETLGLSGALIAVDTFPGKAAEVLDFARAHHLEGAVVKRADSIYRSGRASTWLKFKARHPQCLWVTAWQPGRPGQLDRYWVGRSVNGALEPAGEVAFGLKPGQAGTLRPILKAASLAPRRPDGLIPVAPVVAMTIDSHGRTTGWLRDPIIAAIDIDPAGP